MRMLLHWRDGSILPAILISTVGDRLRVAIPACEDAVDFRWADGRWIDETGEVADIQFDAEPEVFDLCMQLSAEKGKKMESLPSFDFGRAPVATPFQSAVVN